MCHFNDVVESLRGHAVESRQELRLKRKIGMIMKFETTTLFLIYLCSFYVFYFLFIDSPDLIKIVVGVVLQQTSVKHIIESNTV